VTRAAAAPACVDEWGFKVLSLADSERAPEADPRETGANAIRVPYAPGDEARLRSRGFVIKPTWIAWLADVPDGVDSLLAAQASRARYEMRVAIRDAAAKSVRVLTPVDPDAYDEWLRLYLARIHQMRNGVEVAVNFKEEVLDPESGHSLVTWHEDGRLVGGCVIRRVDADSLLHIRFTAVDPAAEGRNLTRAMYARLAEVARERGLRTLSLGFDPNLFGAMVMPGLCAFKLRLGFRPVPARVVRSDMSVDVAELVCRLDGLEQPVLLFEYPSSPVTEGLRLVAFVERGFDSHILTSLPARRTVVVGPRS
jgi:GNAT superfamily N-acetyltransferase